MQIAGENDIDIMLDGYGQPVADDNGEAALVSGDMCWMQDIRNEALTDEGEIFYEDEDSDESYGFGLLDFQQQEQDEFTEVEIQQRIRAKLSKRDYIDAASIQTSTEFDGKNYHIQVSFKKNDSNEEYNLDIETDGVEVILA